MSLPFATFKEWFIEISNRFSKFLVDILKSHRSEYFDSFP